MCDDSHALQEKKLNIFAIATGKQLRSYKSDDSCEFIKARAILAVDDDRSGSHHIGRMTCR